MMLLRLLILDLRKRSQHAEMSYLNESSRLEMRKALTGSSFGFPNQIFKKVGKIGSF